jgi:hypothetical protein
VGHALEGDGDLGSGTHPKTGLGGKSTCGHISEFDSRRPHVHSVKYNNSESHVEVYGFGGEMPELVREEITAMFNAYYYRYHYLQKMLHKDRIRIVLLGDQGVLGFCTIQQIGLFAILSNLLVSPDKQGMRLGSLLEDIRSQLCREHGLVSYSSCVTVGLGSQRLKEARGLKPINIKLGYRQQVFSAEDISSAVTYLSPMSLANEVQFNGVKIDQENKRVRIVACDESFLCSSFGEHANRERFYVDVLVPPRLASVCDGNSELVFHGIDISHSENSWGVLFQQKNETYERASSIESHYSVPIDVLLPRVRGEYMAANRVGTL